MRTFFSLLKTELKLNIRNMNMVIFAAIMPLWYWSSLVLFTRQSLHFREQIIRSWSSP